MVFTIGVITALIGWAFVNLLGGPNAMRWNHFDHFGAVMFILGLGMMASSLLALAWRYMP